MGERRDGREGREGTIKQSDNSVRRMGSQRS